MRNVLPGLFLASTSAALALEAPVIHASRSGDSSVVLHWSCAQADRPSGYRVYRATNSTGPFLLQSREPLQVPRWCDFEVQNGRTFHYKVSAMTPKGEGPSSQTVALTPKPFGSDDEFLEFLQRAHFDYFWFGANPVNGLVPDRSAPGSPCSIAAVGFGLSALGIGIDHGWITRREALQRARATVSTFARSPQGPEPAGKSGYRGWYYHFLDMNTGVRFTPFKTELSSIDTALLLAGMLDAKQCFDRPDPDENEIRSLVDAVFKRVDWAWMARGSNVLSMGWLPDKGFLPSNWIGYNEAMILYIMGLGASGEPLPASAWSMWTSGYVWQTNYGQAYIQFPPLFGHQYSHCWIDFREVADEFMRARGSTYFENSRRATLAQRGYCISNPGKRAGYSGTVWGLTACDGPQGYAARGAPPPENDDGTVAPTAAGGSTAFTPEASIPTLRHFYQAFRGQIWTPFGFRDAFNPGRHWWAQDTLGIDQGPILLMIENYRTGRVWGRFMRNPEIQLGLQRAGFSKVGGPTR